MPASKYHQSWSFGRLEESCIVEGSDGDGLVIHCPFSAPGGREFTLTELERIVEEHNALLRVPNPSALLKALAKCAIRALRTGTYDFTDAEFNVISESYRNPLLAEADDEVAKELEATEDYRDE